MLKKGENRMDNYISILENENKEFKRQINELQIQKNKCEHLNSNLNSLTVTSSTSAISLFILLIYVLMIKKNN